MITNQTHKILTERGETNYTLYKKIEHICEELGETPPQYNTVLAFVRNNTTTVNKKVWWLVAKALSVSPADLFDFSEVQAPYLAAA